MLARLASLRSRLLAAMILVGLAGTAGAYVLDSSLRQSDERSADRAKALVVARQVAKVVQRGVEVEDIRTIQQTLPDDRIWVYRGGRLVYRGPARARPLELTVTSPFPGGRVVLEDHESVVAAAGVSPWVLVAIVAVVLALVIVAALFVATLVVRALRGPIEQATRAARQVAAGDLTARLGPFAAGEFAELGSTFDEMVERLERADRDQRRFLRDVAHEIATPVNAIRGFALALADGTMTKAEDRVEAIELVENQGRRLDTLLDDLRHLTRLDLAETVATERIDVGRLLRDLERRFGAAATAAGVSLSVARTPSPPLTFDSDRRLLETVLDNFVTNAIRYTPEGGTIQLSGERRDGEVAIAVRDTGIGIAPEHQRRIFDRLYRVDEARDRASGGSGLGLAIAQRAAMTLRGHIELVSRPGDGSEFSLVLPV